MLTFAGATLLAEVELPGDRTYTYAGRNLDDVVRATGSREAAFDAMERGAQAAVDAGRLTGKFETAVDIGGVSVTVRGWGSTV